MLTDASAAARQAAAYMTIFWQKRSSRGAENRHRQTLAAAMHVSTACAQAHMCHVPNGRVVKEVASVRTSLQKPSISRPSLPRRWRVWSVRLPPRRMKKKKWLSADGPFWDPEKSCIVFSSFFSSLHSTSSCGSTAGAHGLRPSRGSRVVLSDEESVEAVIRNHQGPESACSTLLHLLRTFIYALLSAGLAWCCWAPWAPRFGVREARERDSTLEVAWVVLVGQPWSGRKDRERCAGALHSPKNTAAVSCCGGSRWDFFLGMHGGPTPWQICLVFEVREWVRSGEEGWSPPETPTSVSWYWPCGT